MTTTLLLAAIPAVYCLLMLLMSAIKRPDAARPDAPDPAAALKAPAVGEARLRGPRRVTRLMRRAMRLPTDQPAVGALRAEQPSLTVGLLSLRRALRHAPVLPLSPAGEPRMVSLAREALRRGQPTAPLLTHALEGVPRTTLAEREALPLCVRVLLAERLARTLRRMLAGDRQTRRGARLARRLMHSRHPRRLLTRHAGALPCQAAMLTALRAKSAAKAIAQVDAWLAEAGSSAAAVARAYAQEQSRLAGSLARLTAAFEAIDRLDWPRHIEHVDALHQLLSDDPSGVYPRMDGESRRMYRERLAFLARLARIDEETAARTLLTLCKKAEKDALERHVGWYLLEAPGVRALRRALKTWRGWLHTALWLHPGRAYRALLWVLAPAFALPMLEAGYPLWLAPVLLTVTGRISRAIAGKLGKLAGPEAFPPRMAMEELSDDTRTLLVLPAVLRDRHEAIRAVKQLATARRAMPGAGVDCLLLGDWDESMTIRAAGDEEIALAATTALAALPSENGTRWLYLQRARAWNPVRRAFAAREGRHGAIGMVCRLMTGGEAIDEADFASFDPAELNRKYAWAMTITPDVRLEPGTLLKLAGAMAHPLNIRAATARGSRGFSLLGPRMLPLPSASETRFDALCRRLPRGEDGFAGVGLIRPDALLENADGWLLPERVTSAGWLAGELAGYAAGSARAYRARPSSVEERLLADHERTRRTWQLLPWLLPWVKTPRGVRRNPLTLPARFALRERFRESLIPLFQIAALLISAYRRDPWVFALALLAPWSPWLGSPRGWLAGLAETALAPDRACLRLDAMARTIAGLAKPGRRDSAPPRASLPVLALWAQAATAAMIAAVSAWRFPWFAPGLVTAALLACSPLVMRWMDAPAGGRRELSDDAASQLTDIAAATWRFFEESVSGALPPANVQTQPDLGASGTTTPEAVGLYLLSCLAARELGLIATAELTRRVSAALDQLERAPRWEGLLFAEISLGKEPSGAPSRVPAAENGLLCACLLTVAQGLRAFLPETEDTDLPARADAFAAGMRLSALFDPETGLFHAWVDPEKAEQDAPTLDLFADDGLPLSFVAVMRREVSPEHLARLRRTAVRAGRARPMLTRHGAAREALAPWLLLPAPSGTPPRRAAEAAVRLQRKYALDGVFGVSASAFNAFDERLRYAARSFGVPETARTTAPFQPVYAPYAAALCLPFEPTAAADSLQRMRALGMFGHLGFLDAVDYAPSRVREAGGFALIRLQSAAHQGMLLCAVCNALTDGALRRCFMALPMAEAFAPLLWLETDDLTLPPPARFPLTERPPEPSFRRVVRTDVSPAEAHLVGSGAMSQLISAQGTGALRASGRDVTRFSGKPWAVEGPQFYLAREDRVFRLLSPALPGETVFGEGMARFTRACGEMQTAVTLLSDPVASAAVQVVELVSQSPLDETVELADCLLPAADGPAARPMPRVLTLPMDGGLLVHSVHLTEEPLALGVQTSRAAFLGGGGDRAPGLFAEPMADGVADAYLDVCLSFRVRLRLPRHGRATVTFVTRFLTGRITRYLPPSLPDLTALSRLSARALTDALPLTQARAALLPRLIGALTFRGQSHQGAPEPLMLSGESLLSDRRVRGALPAGGANQPLLTVQLMTEDGLPLLREAADALGWMLLAGQSVSLCVLCLGDAPEELADQAEALLDAAIQRRPSAGGVCILADLSDDAAAMLRAVSRLTLIEGRGGLAEQLDALAVPLQPARGRQPAPGELPDPGALLFDNGLSGFDPQTGDMVIHGTPEESLLADWRFPLKNGRFTTLARLSGLAASRAGDTPLTAGETALIVDADTDEMFPATPLPFGDNLPWTIRFSPGVASWRTRTDTLDATLTASCVPRRAAGLRTLRLRNLTDRELRLIVHLATDFSLGDGWTRAAAHLTPVTGGVAAVGPSLAGSAFVTMLEGGCAVRVATEAEFHGLGVPLPDAPDTLHGAVALMSVETSIQAGGSAIVSWLTGCAAQADDMELLLRRARRSGASAIFRAVRQQAWHRTGRVTFTTPEASLDLLLDHWLPWQFLQGGGPLCLAARTLLAPEDVRPRLLLLARDGAADDLLPWLTARYVRVTGDEGALNDLVPHDAGHPDDARDTLYARCMTILTASPADEAYPTLLRIEALRAFAACADEPDQVTLLALRQKFMAGAERFLDEAVAHPDAKTAAWLALALGSTPRTAEVMRTALNALYDPMNGLVAARPGEPQDTVAALWLTMALARMGWLDQAWELARALNPIHHADEPHRAAAYRGEPYAVAGQMYAAPPHAGQAGGEPSAEAAALMYLLLVEELLGLDRQGDRLALRPLTPPDWEDFSVALRVGASTWYLRFDRRRICMVDGEIAEVPVRLSDDGGVHEVRAPIRDMRSNAFSV